MSGKAIADRAEAPRRDRRAERRDATRTEILEAAWDLAREQGLTELSLRDLGERVGMRAQSIYSYFDSKHAIYDAMFQEGNEELLRRMEVVRDTPSTPKRALPTRARTFVDFALEDLPRCQLMFLRTCPGSSRRPRPMRPPCSSSRSPGGSPTWESPVRRCSTSGPRLLSGIMQQQWANDPGGDRWRKLVDDVIAMYLAYTKKRRS